jgi:hypothetical protein
LFSSVSFLLNFLSSAIYYFLVFFTLNMFIFLPLPISIDFFPNIFLILFLRTFLTFHTFLRSFSPCCFLFLFWRLDWYTEQNLGKDMKYLSGWHFFFYCIHYSFTMSKRKQLFLWAFSLVTHPLHVPVFVHTLFIYLHNIVICPRHDRSTYDTSHSINENYHLSLSNVLCTLKFNDWVQNYFLESLWFTGQDNLKA